MKWKEDELLGAPQQMTQREHWHLGAGLGRVEEWTHYESRACVLTSGEIVAAGKRGKEKV